VRYKNLSGSIVWAICVGVFGALLVSSGYILALLILIFFTLTQPDFVLIVDRANPPAFTEVLAILGHGMFAVVLSSLLPRHPAMWKAAFIGWLSMVLGLVSFYIVTYIVATPALTLPLLFVVTPFFASVIFGLLFGFLFGRWYAAIILLVMCPLEFLLATVVSARLQVGAIVSYVIGRHSVTETYFTAAAYADQTFVWILYGSMVGITVMLLGKQCKRARANK
jgi:hypothetical protein